MNVCACWRKKALFLCWNICTYLCECINLPKTMHTNLFIILENSLWNALLPPFAITIKPVLAYINNQAIIQKLKYYTLFDSGNVFQLILLFLVLCHCIILVLHNNKKQLSVCVCIIFIYIWCVLYMERSSVLYKLGLIYNSLSIHITHTLKYS